MNANDKTEKVLREIHIMLSKAEPYKPEPSRVIINKQQMIDLLAELNKCIYAIQDEYELTEQSRNHAEREFRKKGELGFSSAGLIFSGKTAFAAPIREPRRAFLLAESANR